MDLIAATPSDYLSEDEVIDFSHPAICDLVDVLDEPAIDDSDFARRAFEHVRDHVAHSIDVQDPRITIRASEVASHGVGLCFAKSHLLAAILRAKGIPTGLCYQRLTDGAGGHLIHGLVAIHLNGAWHRQDPRGNKPGVDAQFSLTAESLAWAVNPELDECDYPEVFARPHPKVIAALQESRDAIALCAGGLPSSL